MNLDSTNPEQRWEHVWEERWAGRTCLAIYRGNRDGFVGHDHLGKPTRGMYACAEVIHLMDPDAGLHYLWVYGAVGMGLSNQPQNRNMDSRIVGLVPSYLTERTPSQVVDWIKSNIPKEAKWFVTRSGTMVHIRADVPSGERRKHPVLWEWILDSGKGGEVVSCKCETSGSQGEPIYFNRCQTTYMKVDDRWWPAYSKVEQTYMTLEVEVTQASFNRPEHPKKLTPSEMGIPVGMKVTARGLGWQPDEVRRWTGREIVTEEEFKAKGLDDTPYRRLREQEYASGHREFPAWWHDATGHHGVENAPRKPSEWETYVRRWCIVNEADDTQRKAAQGILKSCQERAFELLSRNRRERESIESKLKSPPADAKALESLRMQEAALWRPVEELFAELQRRFNPLLRENQRRGTMPASGK